MNTYINHLKSLLKEIRELHGTLLRNYSWFWYEHAMTISMMKLTSITLLPIKVFL